MSKEEMKKIVWGIALSLIEGGGFDDDMEESLLEEVEVEEEEGGEEDLDKQLEEEKKIRSKCLNIWRNECMEELKMYIGESMAKLG